MRPKAKRPTVPVQSLGLESRPGLDVPRRAVPERRVFESGNKAERSAPIGSNVDGAHPRGPRDPTPAGRGAPQKDPSPIVYSVLRSGGTGRSPRRSGNERASTGSRTESGTSRGTRRRRSGTWARTIRRRARRAVTIIYQMPVLDT